MSTTHAAGAFEMVCLWAINFCKKLLIDSGICRVLFLLRPVKLVPSAFFKCLRFLATGDSFKSISFSYRLGHSTVQTIVNEICRVIVSKLMAETMPMPTEERWKEIAEEFKNLWHFPNCIGTIDGKHVTIQAPANTGTQYFNYKKTFSVVLWAIVDARYNFVAVDVGAFGKNSDGGILAKSNIGKAMERKALNIPNEALLPNSVKKAPFVYLGDEAFPLKCYMLRPYPRNQLNDKKKRKHMVKQTVVKNTFGILSQKFRVFHRQLQSKPENADYIILSTCILHNFINKQENHSLSCVNNDTARSAVNFTQLHDLPTQGGNCSNDAFLTRETLKEYVNDEGAFVTSKREAANFPLEAASGGHDSRRVR
ncbi:uncharacterized protein LOC143187484 [Calliopsis andreniformis]|uniref:uncharacterized protein LOC143187484 n=1 Tax=Calliopsis andreniformis TaxID=337506 RepID=UPI003FCC7BEC